MRWPATGLTFNRQQFAARPASKRARHAPLVRTHLVVAAAARMKRHWVAPAFGVLRSGPLFRRRLGGAILGQSTASHAAPGTTRLTSGRGPSRRLANGRRAIRAGFTVLELLVALAVIGILMAIAIPAILHAREASRRTACTANMRQIGLGILQYESVHRVFPPGGSHPGSYLVLILPHVGQQTLYDRLQLHERAQQKIVAQIMNVALPLYLCPSDPAPAGGGTKTGGTPARASTSYSGNSGTGVQADGYNGIFQHTKTVYPRHYPEGFVRAADVRDGLSNTAAVAEIRHGDGTYDDRLRVRWNTPRSLTRPSQRDAFVALCGSVPQRPRDYGWMGDPTTQGTPWTEGDLGMTMYNHLMPPNSPSCLNGGAFQFGAYTAGSLHQGGLNVLYADGRVSFTSTSIDLGAWREIGSRVARSVREQFMHELEEP